MESRKGLEALRGGHPGLREGLCLRGSLTPRTCWPPIPPVREEWEGPQQAAGLT